jgi:hypothetical protein
MISRILPLCLLPLVLASCQRLGPGGSPVNTGGPSGSMTWHNEPPDKSPPIPGIDHGGAQFEGKIFVLWAANSSGGGSSSSSNSSGINGKGHVRFANGQTTYEFSTTDGKTGPVKIDGVSYDLANGALFLLIREEDKSRVKQLKKDLSGLELTSPGFQKFGRADPEIMEFFSDAKFTDPPPRANR